MHANTATTASKTKTKPNAIRTPSTSGVIPGHAPLSQDSKPHSTAQFLQASSPATARHTIHAGTAAKNSPTSHDQTGTGASST